MSRPEICPNCCPNGGAIFRRDYAKNPETGEYEWCEKVCQNCGHVKKPRARQARLMIDPNTCTSEQAEAARFNASRSARFHYFNPAGVWGEWQQFDEVIQAAVDAGVIKNGYFLAYGTLGDSFYYDRLSKAATSNRPKRRDVDYTVQAIRRTIERGRASLSKDCAEQGRSIDEFDAIAAPVWAKRATQMQRERQESVERFRAEMAALCDD